MPMHRPALGTPLLTTSWHMLSPRFSIICSKLGLCLLVSIRDWSHLYLVNKGGPYDTAATDHLQ
jgi:hypothetical protein